MVCANLSLLDSGHMECEKNTTHSETSQTCCYTLFTTITLDTLERNTIQNISVDSISLVNDNNSLSGISNLIYKPPRALS